MLENDFPELAKRYTRSPCTECGAGVGTICDMSVQGEKRAAHTHWTRFYEVRGYNVGRLRAKPVDRDSEGEVWDA